jgi:hypothetical protein
MKIDEIIFTGIIFGFATLFYIIIWGIPWEQSNEKMPGINGDECCYGTAWGLVCEKYYDDNGSSVSFIYQNNSCKINLTKYGCGKENITCRLIG